MTHSKADKKLEKSGLTEKQKAFCREYVLDWNGTRAYKVAYPNVNENTAAVNANRLLRNAKIEAYCEEIKNDLEKLCGISKAKIINEHLKLAYSSIAHLHNTWITRKDFEQLTEDQKSCIAEIATQVRTVAGDEEHVPVQVEYVKVKLYDKQKALDSIAKLMGYDAPQKLDLTNKGEKFQSIDYSKLDESVLRAIVAAGKPETGKI